MRKMMKKKKSKRLQDLIMKNFLAFTIVYLVCYLLLIAVVVFVAGLLENRENAKWEKLLMPDLNNKKLSEVDWSGVIKSHSGVEVLDENFKVIYRKGVNFHQGSSYTKKELLDILQLPIEQNDISKVGMISFDVGRNQLKNMSYHKKILKNSMLIHQTFYDKKRNWRLCLQLISKDYLDNHSIRIAPPNNDKVIFVSGVLVALGGIGLLFLILKLFSKHISVRIGKPVSSLTDGLKEITQGNYMVRIDYEAENELSQMKEAFNYMAMQMEKAEQEKKYFEKERQMLFSNIAHDLKTPITTILGYSKALAEGMVKEEEKNDYFLGIQQKSKRVSELINLLLSYTKLENQEYHLNFKSLDLVEFVRSVVAENYNLFEESGTELEMAIAESLSCVCLFDPIECRRAITNVLVNAIKHNPSHTLVCVSMEVVSDSVQIDIADNGVPVAKNLKERLFEPFVLGDDSRNSKGGSGLGLSISKRITEKHGGTLQLLQDEDYQVSEFTKCFRISLPIRRKKF